MRVRTAGRGPPRFRFRTDPTPSQPQSTIPTPRHLRKEYTFRKSVMNILRHCPSLVQIIFRHLSLFKKNCFFHRSRFRCCLRVLVCFTDISMVGVEYRIITSYADPGLKKTAGWRIPDGTDHGMEEPSSGAVPMQAAVCPKIRLGQFDTWRLDNPPHQRSNHPFLSSRKGQDDV